MKAKTARTLDSGCGNPGCNQGGIAIVESVYCMTVGGYADVSENQSPTLMSRDYKSPPVIHTPRYIIRRLTPLEACRLQGFPDDWCAGLETPEPTEEEIDWWVEVFETRRRAIGKSTRPRSRKQITKWLKAPYTDGATFKMWGNGIALPCARFVMAGIAWAHQQEYAASKDGRDAI